MQSAQFSGNVFGLLYTAKVNKLWFCNEEKRPIFRFCEDIVYFMFYKITYFFFLFFLSGSGKTTSKNVEVSMCVVGPKGKVVEVTLPVSFVCTKLQPVEVILYIGYVRGNSNV